MNPEPQTPQATPAKTVSVKIFGVGTAGVVMLETMMRGDFAGASFVAVNTDAESLAASTAAEKIQLETKLMRGMGTGGDPERGRSLGEEHAHEFRTLCTGTDVVFIVTGLGGGAGTGVVPVLARAAKKAGALVLAFVTTPFVCEGNRRQRQAQDGLELLKAAADGVICMPCEKVLKLIDENTSLVDTFQTTSQLLLEGARGVWRLLAHSGLIRIHFADLCALLRDRHAESCFAAVEVSGENRSADAVEKLLAHPMLDAGAALGDADAVMVSLMGGPDLTMAQINTVMQPLNEKCPNAQVIMGAAVDEAFRGRLSVTLIATSKAVKEVPKPVVISPEESATDGETPDFETDMLHQHVTKRPPARLVPPPPLLSTEQREEILAQRTGKTARARKPASPRLKQTQLQLDIVSKGRFDNTEPTVYKGEDLDVPTYIRRGMALN